MKPPLFFALSASGARELRNDAIEIVSMSGIHIITVLHARALEGWNIRRVCACVEETVVKRLERESFSVLVDLSALDTFDFTQKKALDALTTAARLLCNTFNDRPHTVDKILLYVATSKHEHDVNTAISELLRCEVPARAYSDLRALTATLRNSNKIARPQPA